MADVLMIVQSEHGASTRYRALQYIPFFARAGAQVRVESLPSDTAKRKALFAVAREYRTTFLQKRLLPLRHARLLRRFSRRLVYDFDDAVCFPDSARQAKRSFTRWLRFRAIARRADLVIAGNGYLRAMAEPLVKSVMVIPTVLNAAKYAAAGPNDRQTVKLGWIGAKGTLPYLERIRPALEKVGAARPNVALKVVSDEFPALDRLPVERKLWSEAEEAADVIDMDIGLAPLVDDAWTRGKCGLKILQYSAASRPVVASPVGVQRDMVANGVSGFWADSLEAWTESILRLVDDAAFRQRNVWVGERGKSWPSDSTCPLSRRASCARCLANRGLEGTVSQGWTAIRGAVSGGRMACAADWPCRGQ